MADLYVPKSSMEEMTRRATALTARLRRYCEGDDALFGFLYGLVVKDAGDSLVQRGIMLKTLIERMEAGTFQMDESAQSFAELMSGRLDKPYNRAERRRIAKRQKRVRQEMEQKQRARRRR